MTEQTEGKPVHKADASPKDTYTHIFGSGFEAWHWWLHFEPIGWDGDYDVVPDEWKMRVVVEDVVVDHATIIATCWKIIQADHHIGVSQETVRNVGCLLFSNDSTDFDANSADELMQWITLGEIVYC